MTPDRFGLGKNIILPLSVLFGILLVLSAAVSSFLVIILGARAPLVESRAAIYAELNGLKETEGLGGIERVVETIETRAAENANTFFYAVSDPAEFVIAGNLPQWSWSDVEVYSEDMLLLEVPHGSVVMPTRSTRPFTEHYDVMMKAYAFDGGYRVYVGRNVDDLEAASWIASRFGWSVISIMVIIVVYIFSLAIYLVTGIRRLSDTATSIMETGDLSLRVPQNTNWHLLGGLAENWNVMLDKIQSLVTQIQNVSNNIAHDLRTPLTRLRVDLEKVEDPAHRKELLEETDTLLAMVNGLLRIAEIETSAKVSAFSEVSLDQILTDAVSFYAPVAEEKHIALSLLANRVDYYGDRDLLFQAFMNVIDNAIKFTPADGEIRVSLHETSETILIEVCDNGPGVPVEDRDEIFNRFYRSDESRGSPGYGLGLSVVSAVMDLHAAEVSLRNNDPGLCVSFRFFK